MPKISIQKHVNFGEVILIVNDKVQWNVQNGIQMEWNENDIWTCIIDESFISMNYRYVIVKQNNKQIIEWEDGITRSINKNQDVNDIWNQFKITITCYYHQPIELYLYTIKGRMKISMNKNNINNDDQYYYEFYIPSKTVNQYAYKYYSNQKWERCGARLINNYPIINNIITIIDKDLNFNLNYHTIQDNIIVGSYFYIDEIKLLNKLGVNAILNLQTIDDLINKDMPEDYFNTISNICQEYNIKYINYPIIDCNKRSFLNKGQKAYQTLKQLLDDGLCVYVHCTDGIQRSIQTIILYLVQDLNYTLEQAINTLQSIRNRSKPIREVLQKILDY